MDGSAASPDFLIRSRKVFDEEARDRRACDCSGDPGAVVPAELNQWGLFFRCEATHITRRKAGIPFRTGHSPVCRNPLRKGPLPCQRTSYLAESLLPPGVRPGGSPLVGLQDNTPIKGLFSV